MKPSVDQIQAHIELLKAVDQLIRDLESLRAKRSESWDDLSDEALYLIAAADSPSPKRDSDGTASAK
jgi:hypothetical protein